MKKLVLFLVFTYSIIYFLNPMKLEALIPVQGYGINLLNSKGNSSIDNDISNIGFMNPAAISTLILTLLQVYLISLAQKCRRMDC